jgi:predicted nucleotidyltransferase
MAKHKKVKKKSSKKKDLESSEKAKAKKTKPKYSEAVKNKAPTLKIIEEKEIALDFATKVYAKFDKMIKSIVLFGSQAKKNSKSNSDIDLIIILDDAAILWDQELITWYREELGKLVSSNPYKKEVHITSVRLTTWWQDMIKGDPIVYNMIRYGEPILDFGGFFTPLKILLQQGKIKPTPEAIYTCLQRAPMHFLRSKENEMNSVEGLYWAMIESANAALMAAKQLPHSPENIPLRLKETFSDRKLLSEKYVIWLREIYLLHKKISRKEITYLKGVVIDEWQERTEQFINEMTRLVKDLIE